MVDSSVRLVVGDALQVKIRQVNLILTLLFCQITMKD